MRILDSGNAWLAAVLAIVTPLKMFNIIAKREARADAGQRGANLANAIEFIR
jgi:hypothetical protein